jgi:hypothetical protein
MDKVSHIETVNVDKLLDVRKCNNFPTKNPDDNLSSFKMARTDLKKYAGYLTNGKRDVKYKSKMPFWGRRMSSRAIQYVPKIIRCHVGGEYYVDIDQVNSHFVTLKLLFQKYDIEDSFLNEYLSDCTETLRIHNFLHNSTVCALINKEKCLNNITNTVKQKY